ncbi:MAG TPA: DUF3006 domain-containing protein [Syntrophomonadaceae bacterium]|nr:DUF3006 domain-containing protein [Syntrophomonadaceae bacterium]
MIKGIIDRFEGDYAVVEIEGGMKVISRQSLPAEACEGDMVVFKKNNWIIDHNAAIGLKKQNEARMERLRKD